MKAIQLILPIILFCSISSISQAQPEVEWWEDYGGARDEYCNSMIQTSDGNFILAGSTMSFGDPHPAHAMIICVNEDGDSLWSQRYINDYGPCGILDIWESDNNDFYLLGWAIDDDNNNVGWLIYVDEEGEFIEDEFVYRENGEGFDVVIAHIEDEGTFYFAGERGTDIYILKAGQDGEELWYYESEISGRNRVRGFNVTEDGEVLVCGSSENFGETSGILLSIDSDDGDESWNSEFSEEGGYVAFYSVEEDADGELVCGGETRIFRFDSEGDILIVHDFSDEEEGDNRIESIYEIVPLPNGDLVISGNYPDFSILRLSPDFEIQWHLDLYDEGLPDYRMGGAKKLVQTADYGYAIATNYESNVNNDEYALIKLGPDPLAGVPRIDQLPELSFREDMVLTVEFENLFGYISDSDDPDSMLAFSIQDGHRIAVDAYADEFSLVAGANWWGRDSLLLTVTDPDDNSDSEWLHVSVQPVDDPPNEFGLLYPADNFEHYGSELAFLWEEATQIEMEINPVSYRINFSYNDEETEFGAFDEASYYVADISEILSELEVEADFDEVRISWWVTALVGVQETESDEVRGLIIHIPNSVEGEEFLPKVFALESVYPNPFNATTTIRFSLPVADDVSLTAIDLDGRVVRSILDAKMNSGSHTIEWNANQVPSGVYYLRLSSGNNASIKKVALIR